MKTVILQRLRDIEHEHGVKILYAVESGSRAWGVESPDSDYDVRFIYKHCTDWYLNIFPHKDVIEYPVSDLLDLSGWDLKKTLLLLHRSNPALLEWLNSPVVYMKDEQSLSKIKTAAAQYFSPKSSIYHHLNMAGDNYRDYIQGDGVEIKKYLYVLRSLLSCKWIELNNSIPPVGFINLVENLPLEPEFSEAVYKFLEQKKAGPELDIYIDENIEYYTKNSAGFSPAVKHPKAELEELFRSLLSIEV